MTSNYPQLRPAPHDTTIAPNTFTAPPRRRPTTIGTADETRTAALKRTAKDSQERNDELEELVHHLRSRPELEAIEILRRLRKSTDVSSILKFIEDGDLMIQQFSNSTDVYDVNAASSRSPLQAELAMKYPNVYHLSLPTWLNQADQLISTVWVEDQAPSEDKKLPPATQELMSSKMKQISGLRHPVVIDFTQYPDGRLSKATCDPWTSVISDDSLFRALISIYLTWTHPAFTLFDKDCFLEDLVNHQHKFCSPMLVNAILSISFFHYILLISPRDIRADTSLGFAFLSEARRLWQLHEGSQTLTMLQAVIVTAFTYNAIGRDKLGFTIYGSALAIATDMGLLSNTKVRNGDHTLFVVEQTTIWGLFCLLNTTCFGLRKSALFRVPPAGLPPGAIRTPSSEDISHSWTPYPYIQPPRIIYMQDLFTASIGFWTIGMDIINRMDLYYHDPSSVPTLIEAEDFYSRLLAWSQSISSNLRLRETSPPFVLILHGWFHIAIIELFRPFTEHGFSRLQSLIASDSRVNAISAESVRQLKMVTVTMALRYDCRLVPLSLLQFALTLCFETKKDLYDDESARVFAICFNLLYDYSHSLPFFDYMLRLLKELVYQIYTDLPPIISKMFKETPELKQANSSYEEIQSSYPIDLDNLGNSLEATRLDNMKERLNDKSWEEDALV